MELVAADYFPDGIILAAVEQSQRAAEAEGRIGWLEPIRGINLVSTDSFLMENIRDAKLLMISRSDDL